MILINLVQQNNWTAESRLTGDIIADHWQREWRSFRFMLLFVRQSVRQSVLLYSINLPLLLSNKFEILKVDSNYVSLEMYMFIYFFSYKVKFEVCSNVLFDCSFWWSLQLELNHHKNLYLIFHFQHQNSQNWSLYIVSTI